MAKRERETADMGAMVDRVVRAIARRAEQGDMDALAVLVSVQDTIRLYSQEVAATLRRDPWNYSWADIGQALGVTRQAAQQRFGMSGTAVEG